MAQSLTTQAFPTPTFILTVKVWISPSDLSEFFTLFRPVYDAVVAEPECLYFVLGQNPQVPGEIWWSEGWRHERGVEWMMDTQIKKEYYKEYLEKTEKMFVKPRHYEIFTPEKDLMMFKLPKEKSEE